MHARKNSEIAGLKPFTLNAQEKKRLKRARYVAFERFSLVTLSSLTVTLVLGVNLWVHQYNSDVPWLIWLLACTVLVWSLVRQAVARHQASVDGLDLAWSMIGAHARMELFNKKLELFDRTTFAISSELTTSAQARRLVEMAVSIQAEYGCVLSDYINDERPARRDFTVHSDGGA